MLKEAHAEKSRLMESRVRLTGARRQQVVSTELPSACRTPSPSTCCTPSPSAHINFLVKVCISQVWPGRLGQATASQPLEHGQLSLRPALCFL